MKGEFKFVLKPRRDDFHFLDLLCLKETYIAGSFIYESENIDIFLGSLNEMTRDLKNKTSKTKKLLYEIFDTIEHEFIHKCLKQFNFSTKEEHLLISKLQK